MKVVKLKSKYVSRMTDLL